MFVLGLALLLTSPAARAGDGWTCQDYADQPALLQELEKPAGIGSLTREQQDCLEKNLSRTKEQTVKGKISRVLLVNAYAYDTFMWSGLVERHLREIDQSDPDVAYLYSFYLYNRPLSPKYDDAIHWSEVALERKDVWSGDTYVKRVSQLMKVRALAAAKIWQGATESGQKELADDARVRTKTFAREWIEYRRSAGLDSTQAELLCVSAAGAAACSVKEEPK